MERVIGDAFELDPKTTGTFDLVLACEALEHVAHGMEFVQHLSTFLNPGRTLLLTTANGSFVGPRPPARPPEGKSSSAPAALRSPPRLITGSSARSFAYRGSPSDSASHPAATARKSAFPAA